MTIKEFNKKIEELRKENPNLDFNELEIGPIFNDGTIMLTTDVYIVEDSAWVENEVNGNTAIGIEWMC